MDIEARYNGIIRKLNEIGVGPERIDSNAVEIYEKKLKVKFGFQTRFYFEKIVGEEGIDVGDHVFLHGLKNLEPAMKYIDAGVNRGFDNQLVFANFDDWCWGYSMDFTDGIDMPVYLMNEKEPLFVKIADSLDEFVLKSIENSSAIL